MIIEDRPAELSPKMEVPDPIPTMKDQPWRSFGGLGCVLWSKFAGNIQFFCNRVNNHNYYMEAANSRRGAVAEIGIPVTIYDIAASPDKVTYDNIKNGFAALLKEKIGNDFHIFETLIEQLKKDDILPKGVVFDYKQMSKELRDYIEEHMG